MHPKDNRVDNAQTTPSIESDLGPHCLLRFGNNIVYKCTGGVNCILYLLQQVFSQTHIIYNLISKLHCHLEKISISFFIVYYHTLSVQ